MSAIRKSSAASSSNTEMSIGQVLEQLHRDFPDVTVSKIRFWESEGLVTPARSAKGYRRFSSADVERLRYILTTQRDNYLPLKVIKERLDAMDAANVSYMTGKPGAAPMPVSAEQFRAPALARLTHSDVCEKAGVDDAFLTTLAKTGVVSADASGFYSPDDVEIARTAKRLRDFGFDERHLKTLRTTAQRHVGLISQAAAPVSRSSAPNAQQKAEEMSRELSALFVSLHTTFVRVSLRQEFDL